MAKTLCEGLVKGAAEKAEKYGGSKDSRALVDMSTGEAKVADVAATHVGEEIFSKGTSKRIWGDSCERRSVDRRWGSTLCTIVRQRHSLTSLSDAGRCETYQVLMWMAGKVV